MLVRASHEVVDWAVTHCTAIHGCDSSSTVEWSKRVHTCQVEVVICGGCVWVCMMVTWCIHVYPELRRPNYLHFTVNLCGRLAHFWRHYVMAADGGSHNGFLCFFSAEACKNLGACHASGRPAYLLVLVYLFSWSLASASQTRRRLCRPSWR